MSTSNRLKTRRKLLVAGGTGLVGIAAFVTGLNRKAATRRRGRLGEAERLAGRLDLPQGAGSMMEAFARDPQKVSRFQELTRWRRAQEKEPSNV